MNHQSAPSLLTPGCILAAFLLLAATTHAGQIPAVDEGWIQSNKEKAADTVSANTTAYSVKKPYRLIVGRDNQSLRAAYLKFDLSALPADAKGVELVMTFFEAEERAARRERLRIGTYLVYGIAGGEWDSATLTANDAPGWSIQDNGVSSDAVPLMEVQVTMGDSEEFRAPSSTDFEAFLEKNKGQLITLIITKKGKEGAQFVPGRMDMEKGPRLQFSP